MNRKKLLIYRFFAAASIGIFLSIFLYFNNTALGAPLLANYILGTLPTDSDSIEKLARFDVLVMNAEQGIVRRSVIDEVKRRNPKIILLAYVPSQSTNDAWNQYPANTLYKDFNMNSNWYLRDSSGRQVSDWPGLKNADMSKEWSDHLINFTQNKILSMGIWDGVFWDMVYDGISSKNKGDIDLNRDGVKEDRRTLDSIWVQRIDYLLAESQRRLPVKYVLMNGTSIPSLQKYVNGRMYENYPTPWEVGGNVIGIMSGLKRNQSMNAKPQMYIFNANTNNTGNRNDFKTMRFGLASSLMLDNIYFSFDYGDKDHNQVWWYDEYGVKLGNPISQSISESERVQFDNNVWVRNYENGLAVVNPTSESQLVDLGGEYEKIIGKQDPITNDGSIVEKVNLKARDGLLLLKTAQNIYNVPFINGSFIRFFDMKGNRARNGFFGYLSGVPGGTEIFSGDLNNDKTKETIASQNDRFEIFNSANSHWFDDVPFKDGASVRFSIGWQNNQAKILVTPSKGSKAILYNYHGAVMNENIFPFGQKYKSGFYGALGNLDDDSDLELVFGSGGSRVGEVVVYDADMKKIKSEFFPFDKKFNGRIKVSLGDMDSDDKSEIITMGKFGNKYVIKIFDNKYKKISEFSVNTVLGANDLNIGTADMNYDGKDEIVIY